MGTDEIRSAAFVAGFIDGEQTMDKSCFDRSTIVAAIDHLSLGRVSVSI